MRKIYIILSYSGSGFSRFLRLFNDDKFVHTSISLDRNLNRCYSFGRKILYFPLPGGFIMEDFRKNVTYFKNSEFKIFELLVDDDRYISLVKDIEDNYVSYINKYRYNIIGLYYIWRNKIKHRDYHFVCSSFCAKVLSDNGVFDFGKDYSLVRPGDFLNLNYSGMVYEGKVIDYFKKGCNF